MHRARNISLVLCFLAILVAPSVASLAHYDPMGALDEKRALAKKPADSLRSANAHSRVPALALAWEKYFNDNFGLRKLLIGSYRMAALYVLGTSPNPAVVVGKSDGAARWLYYDAALAKDGAGFAAFQGKKPYTATELATIAALLGQVTDIAHQHGKGAKLIIAICPDKQTVYPEYLPRDQRPRPGAISRLDQFWAMASALPSVPLLDLRIPLKQAKTDRLLYYPSDTHWNLRGEILAYQSVTRALAAQDPSRRWLPIERLGWTLGSPRVGDLTKLMGLPSWSGDVDWLPDFEGMVPLAGPKQGKLLVIADSFFEALQPYFQLQFESVKWIRHETAAKRVGLVDPAWLDAERPDVVILESVERYWTED